jgi:membrane associated rhomboid family serine protease
MQVFFKAMGLRPGADLTDQSALTISGIKGMKLWTMFTHAWFHSTENVLHIVGVVAGVTFFGRELIPTMGPKKFGVLFFSSILLGAILWCAINWQRGGILIGASAGVFGLFAFFAALKPNLELNFLLLFVIPVSVRLRPLLYAVATASLVASGFYEVYGATPPFPYSPSAHVGGLLAGWLFFHFVYLSNLSRDTLINFSGLEPQDGPKLDFTDAEAEVSPEAAKRLALRTQLDRILDKINLTGLTSLTPAERRILDEAKHHLPRT